MCDDSSSIQTNISRIVSSDNYYRFYLLISVDNKASNTCLQVDENNFEANSFSKQPESRSNINESKMYPLYYIKANTSGGYSKSITSFGFYFWSIFALFILILWHKVDSNIDENFLTDWNTIYTYNGSWYAWRNWEESLMKNYEFSNTCYCLNILRLYPLYNFHSLELKKSQIDCGN